MKLRKKRVVIPVILLVGMICFCTWARWRPAKRFEGVPRAENELRMVTWNVGYFAVASNKNMRDVDVDRIVSTLEEVAPDVVVLQELGQLRQADIIAEKMGKDWEVHSARTGHGEQVSAILSNRKFTRTECFSCGGRMTPGASLEMESGERLYVVGVHSPHPVRGIEENEKNIRCVLRHAREQVEEVRIVAGDMNHDFDPDDESELYAEILNEFGDGTIELGKTYYAQTRIDHMFHYPQDLSVSQPGSGMVDLPLRWAKVPGFRDHRPIVVTYQLR